MRKEQTVDERIVTNDELSLNHEFVQAFEKLRKQFGYREMNDAALREALSPPN